MRNIKPKIAFISWRFYLLSILILIMIAGLLARVFFLSVIERHFLLTQGDARSLRVINEPAFRGMITDRNGYPLAVSAVVYSVWANPQVFSMSAKGVNQLSKILAVDPAVIRNLVQKYKTKGREFVYLKRELSPEVANQIKSLMIPGVYLQHDYKRFYPEGEILAHVIGFTNIDDQGQEGLELAYNSWLAGIPGKELVVKDRRGRVISHVRTIKKQKPGNDLALSIDHHIQYLAYRALMEGVKKNKADSGSIVVLDAKTGEVLAMVNQPSFNPNNISLYKKDSFRNRAVTDIFEPGSTIKAFGIATALSSGLFHPDSVVDTYPGWMRVGRHLVRDTHNNHELTLAQILQLSSNVGMTKIILSLPPSSYWNLLQRIGFGEITGIGFPGEQGGRLTRPMSWDPFMLSTMAFGYGLSTTTLQLAHAYAVLANGGVKVPVSLLRLDHPPTSGERILDEKVASDVLQLLEAVVAKGGTGEAARVPGYRVAGKTGTAFIAGPHGYQQRNYIASFIGVAPVTQPRLIVAVVIRNPNGKNHLGGLVSGPVFEEVMAGALRSLNVPPDSPVSLS